MGTTITPSRYARACDSIEGVGVNGGCAELTASLCRDGRPDLLQPVPGPLQSLEWARVRRLLKELLSSQTVSRLQRSPEAGPHRHDAPAHVHTHCDDLHAVPG